MRTIIKSSQENKYMQTHNIISKDNDKIKNLKKLAKKSWRDETKQFVVENLVIIHDALQAGVKPASLFITEEIQTQSNDKLRYILGRLNECYVINNQINKAVSNLATPSGVIAVYDKPDSEIDLSKNILYLNAISDPGNMGTILRTALAFGIENIVVDNYCVDLYNPKTIQAAKDAIFKVQIAHDQDLEILTKLQKQMTVYATDLEAGIEISSLPSLSSQDRFCLILGNEAKGVVTDIKNKANSLIKVDMTDQIESLNVAIAAGIILHQLWSKK